jgi:hypothetical protein
MSLVPPRSVAEVEAEKAAADAALAASVAEQSTYPFHIALVIDGTVKQVFHIQEELAAILLSSPTIVQCASPADNGPDRGWKYDANTGQFSRE